MKRKTKISIVLTVLALALGVCLIYTQLQPTLYLSFVTLGRGSQDEGEKDMLNVYYQRLDEEEAEMVLSVPWRTSVAAAVYDAKNQCVYYSDSMSAQGEENTGDVLMRYDCNTKESEYLLDTFAVIHALYLRNDGSLIIVAGDAKDTQIQPYRYIPGDGSLQQIELAGDVCTAAYYDPYDDIVYFCGYVKAQKEEAFERYLQAQGEITESDYNVDNHIYAYQSQTEVIATVQTGSISAIAADHGTLLYGKTEGFFAEHLQYEIWKEGESTPVELDASIAELISLSDDQLICLCESRSGEGLYAYNMDTHAFDRTYFFEAEEPIYSARLVKR